MMFLERWSDERTVERPVEGGSSTGFLREWVMEGFCFLAFYTMLSPLVMPVHPRKGESR